MRLTLETTETEQGWSVRLAVGLDRRETSDLFVSGDTLISWPTDGMLSPETAGPLERSSMYLSEIVARPEGLELFYDSESLARRTAQILGFQVKNALPAA